MNSRIVISRIISLVILILISYGLTGSIAAGSWMGIVLAVISLGATLVFLYLLPRLYETAEEENMEQ